MKLEGDWGEGAKASASALVAREPGPAPSPAGSGLVEAPEPSLVTASVYHSAPDFTLHCGDVLDVLRTLPAESVHCVVTSPPYYALRDYGVEGQLGLEALFDCLGWATGSPCDECYVCRMVAVFREVRRVLRRDGSCWVNLGDSYASSWGNQGRKETRGTQRPINGPMLQPLTDERYPQKESHTGTPPPGLKPKDLLLMPARLALALQADGWYVRRDIIWAKGLSFCDAYSGSVMPESAKDRPTTAHEYVWLLSKSARYFYDQEACRETSVTGDSRRPYTSAGAWQLDGRPDEQKHGGEQRSGDDFSARNLRSVWAINPQPFPAAHFATFPEALVRPCILLGTSENGCCPECGAPWERVIKQGGWRPGCCDHYERNAYARPAVQSEGSREGLAASSPVEGAMALEGVALLASDAIAPCTVLDPFLGSGTTALVARQLGRRCIGIELNPDYCELAVRRVIGNETRELPTDAKPAADGTPDLLNWQTQACLAP